MIIFDLGGILVPEAGNAILEGMAMYTAIPQKELAEFTAPLKAKLTTGEMTLREMYDSLSKSRGLSLTADDMLKRHFELYEQHQTERDARVLDLVEKLKLNYTVPCLTNTEKEIAEYNKQHGLFSFFHKAFISTDMGMKKPDVQIYEAVIRELGCRPADAIFIDDNKDYIQGARNAGIDSILYKNFEQLTQKLASYGAKF
ncbi:MAG: HAD family phosphatase [Candidatus Nanoarchaeia archaeon]|nr:HAD family phosphatase [Candidatus Nanoarchaeia archaeon]